LRDWIHTKVAVYRGNFFNRCQCASNYFGAKAEFENGHPITLPDGNIGAILPRLTLRRK
jgi:hypothetical protein